MKKQLLTMKKNYLWLGIIEVLLLLIFNIIWCWLASVANLGIASFALSVMFWSALIAACHGVLTFVYFKKIILPFGVLLVSIVLASITSSLGFLLILQKTFMEIEWMLLQINFLCIVIPHIIFAAFTSLIFLIFLAMGKILKRKQNIQAQNTKKKSKQDNCDS
jgi:hypothetical protein